MALLWEYLSALSVMKFIADLVLKNDCKPINLQKQEVDMENEKKFIISGVYMG